MSVLDFNNAEPQRSGGELIPNGTMCRVIGTIRPGGANRPGLPGQPPMNDGNWLTQSKTSDGIYLSWEFTVVDGPFARRKFWQNMTIAGGEVNEKGESKAGNITKSTIRAMLNSSRNIKPDDTSERAIAARQVAGWADLNGIEFQVKVGVRKGNNGFADQNQIATVIEPGHKDYGAEASVALPASAPQGSWASPAAAVAAPTGSGTPAWAR